MTKLAIDITTNCRIAPRHFNRLERAIETGSKKMANNFIAKLKKNQVKAERAVFEFRAGLYSHYDDVIEEGVMATVVLSKMPEKFDIAWLDSDSDESDESEEPVNQRRS